MEPALFIGAENTGPQLWALTSSAVRRPTEADLAAARDRTLEDVIAPDLRILFVGINPGLWSGATGFHFARPGNRFWRAIARGRPDAHGSSPPSISASCSRPASASSIWYARTTATAAELSDDEIRAGGHVLVDKIVRFRPRKVAFLGVATYRTAFDRPRASVGRQPERIGDSEVWVLPNPSGLNAHYQLPALAAAYAQLRDENP